MRVRFPSPAGSVTSLIEETTYRVHSPDDITPSRGFARLDQRAHRLGISEDFDALFQLFEGGVRNEVGDMLMIASDQADHAPTRHRARSWPPRTTTATSPRRHPARRRWRPSTHAPPGSAP